MARQINIIDHPVLQHKLTLMRKQETESHEFKRLMSEAGLILTYEASSFLKLTQVEITTPVTKTKANKLSRFTPILISILRAGNGLLDGASQLLPTAATGFIGLYRTGETQKIVEYYCNLPEGLSCSPIFAVDPMLATGHSAVVACKKLKEAGAKDIHFICLVAAPEGVEYFHKHHPDIPITTASVDERLNENAYIVPGLGDAGDRIYNT